MSTSNGKPLPAYEAVIVYFFVIISAETSLAMQLCGKESGSHRRLALNGEKLAMGRAASQIIVNLWEGANDSDVDEQKVWVYENNVSAKPFVCSLPLPIFFSICMAVLLSCNL